jgi:hypothetical protein
MSWSHTMQRLCLHTRLRCATCACCAVQAELEEARRRISDLDAEVGVAGQVAADCRRANRGTVSEGTSQQPLHRSLHRTS